MAAPAAAAPSVEHYDCRDCGGRFTIGEMSKSHRRGRTQVYGLCLACRRVQKRAQERRLRRAPRGADGTVVESVAEPDPTPARLLAAMLIDDRREGVDFNQAWGEDVRLAVWHIRDPTLKAAWRDALEGTRAAWQAAWRGVPGPGRGLSAELVQGLEGVPL